MLERLGRLLSESVRRILRLPIVDEGAVKELVRDLQRALLQSDVNVELVLRVSKAVEERALREKLPLGISRREHVIKVLYEELTKMVGEEPAKPSLVKGRTNVLMLVGIQGSGKTTASAKLAKFYKSRGMRVALVCADTYRPGAFEQLRQLAERVGVPILGEGRDPKEIVRAAIEKAKADRFDLVIIDTAGRHKNEAGLMVEMAELAEIAKPDEIVLVIDGTIGQQAAPQAEAFRRATAIGSILVTKLDGSAKGGGALSAVAATGAKIKFISSGEGLDDIEPFVPSDYIGRLLGMGDLKGLLERVRRAEAEVPRDRARAILEGKFTLRDLYEQMESLRKMGPLRGIWKMLPGGYELPEEGLEAAERKLSVWKAIIQSMTKEEVEDPKIINSSRIRRIARGSGTSEKDVKELLSQYFAMRKMMKSLRKRRGLPRGLPRLP
ncbi:MAG: signal recognition particle protein Srp54 [Candidatus Bathyarchaeia archaeon]